MDKTTLFEGVKGIIFDLDGTLMDSMGVWLDIDDKFFKSHGMECPSDYQKSISHKSTMEGAIYTKEKYHLSETPEELCTLWKNMALAQYSKDIKLKPYALDILKEFKSRGYKIALAT